MAFWLFGFLAFCHPELVEGWLFGFLISSGLIIYKQSSKPTRHSKKSLHL